MLSPRMRPRFEMHVPLMPGIVLEHITRSLNAPDCPCTGEIAGNHIHLNMNHEEQRLWSPHLNLELQKDGAGTNIHGHFGPRSDIWTLAMALYAISGFIATMGLLFGVSQSMLGMSPYAFWFVAGAALLALVVYLLALTGQKLSQNQMNTLFRYVETVANNNQTTSTSR